MGEKRTEAPLDVFVSFSNLDREWVTWIRDALESRGVRVRVLDRPEREVGLDWIHEIESGMEGSAHCFALYSPNYASSTWCMKETRLAEALTESRSDRYLIPIRIHPDAQPFGFARLRSWVDLTGIGAEEGERRLGALLHQLGIPVKRRRTTAATSAFPGSPALVARVDEERQMLIRCLEDDFATDLGGLHRPGGPLLTLAMQRLHDVLNRGRGRRLDPRGDVEPIPPGATLLDVAEGAPRGLLVLGNPGAGKTVELLAFARDRLRRASLDPTRRIPVRFRLSRWTSTDTSLRRWLVSELQDTLNVPKGQSERLVHNEELDVLLDGLDEVPAAHREACLEAINEFVRESPVQVVVTARSRDYAQLQGRLALQRAVELAPLERSEVLTIVRAAGPEAVPLLERLEVDDELLELLRTPLMLRISLLAAPRLQRHEWNRMEPADRRATLFESFVESMASRRAIPEAETDRLVRDLGWLADGMQRHDRGLFLVERLQETWLPPRARRRNRLTTRGILTLHDGLIGAAIGGVLGGFFGRYGFDPEGGRVGFLLGAAISLLVPPGRVHPTPAVRWSGLLAKATLWRALVVSLVIGAVAGFGGGVFHAAREALLIGGVAAAAAFVIGAFVLARKPREIVQRTRLNQEMWDTAWSALVSTSLTWLSLFVALLALFGSLNERFVSTPPPMAAYLELKEEAVLMALAFALAIGGLFGTRDLLRHLVLRRSVDRSLSSGTLANLLSVGVNLLVLQPQPGGRAFLHGDLREDLAARSRTGDEERASHPGKGNLGRLVFACVMILVAAGSSSGVRRRVHARALDGSRFEGGIEEWARRAVELDPEYAAAWAARAFQAIEEDRLEDASNYATRALELDPALGLAIHVLGGTRFAKGSVDEALELLDRAHSIDPGLRSRHELECLWLLGKRSLARDRSTSPTGEPSGEAEACEIPALRVWALEAARDQIVDDPWWMRRYSFALIEAGRFAEVEEIVSRALDPDPREQGFAAYLRSKAMITSGNVDAARDALLPACEVARNPEVDEPAAQLILRMFWRLEIAALYWTPAVTLELASITNGLDADMDAEAGAGVLHWSLGETVGNASAFVILGSSVDSALFALSMIGGVSEPYGIHATRWNPLASTELFRAETAWWALSELHGERDQALRDLDMVIDAFHDLRVDYAVRAFLLAEAGDWIGAVRDLARAEQENMYYEHRLDTQTLIHCNPCAFDWNVILAPFDAAVEQLAEDPRPRLQRAALRLLRDDVEGARADRREAERLMAR